MFRHLCFISPLVAPRLSPSLVTIPKLSHPPYFSIASMTVRGPQSPPPDYSSIDRNPFNKQLMAIFRAKLDAELGYSVDTTGYAGIIAVVRALADRHRANPHALRDASQRVLMSLFPSWLPNAFAVMFSKPIPHFAAWINAVVTVLVTQWLMGPSKLADDGTTVEIERCRYLEESGCVGICANSCKTATEEFFHRNMGIDLAIEPNLEDYSCKFQFGQSPKPQSQDPFFQETCFTTCPMNGAKPGSVCETVKTSQ